MVFISYSRKDRDIAKQFENFLVSIGFNVWIDYKELLYINDFYNQIREAIISCDMVVFLNSANSNSSGWVHFEKSLVRNFSKPHVEFDIENPIGIGSSLAATPSHTTVRTDRVYGGSADQEGY